MQKTIGWQSALPQIIAAGNAARHPNQFDEQLRSSEVQSRVAEARKFPWWPVPVALFLFALPDGWVVGFAVLFIFGGMVYLAKRRGTELQASLDDETKRLRAASKLEIAHVNGIAKAADTGDPAALEALLARWHERRPESIRSITLDFSIRPVSSSTDDGESWAYTITGRALPWDEIPSGVLRIGRGGRVVVDARKVREIDEDLAELNAAAVISVLIALFSGPTALPVTVLLTLPSPTTGAMVPWIALSAMVGHQELQEVCAPISSAVEAIRRLGGDVGRWRNQRFTPAREPVAPALDSYQLGMPAAVRRVSLSSAGARSAPVVAASPPPSSSHPSTATGTGDPHGSRGGGIIFGEVIPSPQPVVGGAIPPAPLHLRSGGGSPRDTPSPRNVIGEFSTVARKFAAYEGDPAARFVPFKAYYSTYAQMAPGQLRFYFKWRNAVRNGKAPRTDLSYIFVHVYELLHLIGAENAPNAGQQLERLWIGYRGTFPNLDHYLVPWIADLYATEVAHATALEFVERAVQLGAHPGLDELIVVTDEQWGGGAYTEMSNASLSLLVGGPRLGDNKFYRTNNTTSDGDGWVDGAYRTAFAVTDEFFLSRHGRTPRDQTIATSGYRTVSRVAFQGAVYDWKQKAVVLGKVANISDAAPAVLAYRNAVRYAENLLRKERHFAAKLRGITIDPGLAGALDARFETFIRSTRPKAKVTIDLSRARELARESVDVRARLLEGVDGDLGVDIPSTEATPSRLAPATTPTSAPVSPEHSPPAPPATSGANPELLAAGLLTDLDAVREAISLLSAPARALVEALAAQGWEAAESAPELEAATSGSLIGPLVDEINERAVDAIRDILIVTEGDTLVVQEDFRDEVHWVLHGSLDGFGGHITEGATSRDTATSPNVAPTSQQVSEQPDMDGFGPAEARALAIIARGGAGAVAELSRAAVEQATTPLLLIDRINECALASSYGDIMVDAAESPPIVLEDARHYVEELLSRVDSPLEASVSPSHIR